ncbi:MAG: YeeE/YedE family protein [Fluviicola sp.]|nr:YeeE/YedE family protein [Fluviicola sp.]
MRSIKFLLAGIVFGIIMYKSEAVSWYRIHEMFRFESFHMYGIIGSALFLGVLLVQWIKRSKMKNIYGQPIAIEDKEKSFWRYILGGSIFGMGWALSGACPGPMYVLVGTGAMAIMIVIFGAIIGTFLYGVLRTKLPH